VGTTSDQAECFFFMVRQFDLAIHSSGCLYTLQPVRLCDHASGGRARSDQIMQAASSAAARAEGNGFAMFGVKVGVYFC